MKCGNCQANNVANRLQPPGADLPRQGREPDQRRSGAGHRSDRGVEGADPLQGRVHRDVDRQGREHQGGGQQVERERQADGARDPEREGQQDGSLDRHAPGDERPEARALHERVGVALQHLVEDAGAARHQGHVERRLERAQEPPGRTEPEQAADRRGQEHHDRDARAHQGQPLARPGPLAGEESGPDAAHATLPSTPVGTRIGPAAGAPARRAPHRAALASEPRSSAPTSTCAVASTSSSGWMVSARIPPDRP